MSAEMRAGSRDGSVAHERWRKIGDRVRQGIIWLKMEVIMGASRYGMQCGESKKNNKLTIECLGI